MFVYETDQFRSEVETHGLRQNVDGFNERLGRAQTRAEVAERTRARWPWYISRVSNFRLIGGIETVSGQDVYCWYRVFPRGGKDYTPFRDLTDEQIKGGFDPTNLQSWFDQRTREEKLANLPHELPDEHYNWFEPVRELGGMSTEGGSSTILESPSWVTEIGQYLRIDRVGFYNAVLQISNTQYDEAHLFTPFEVSNVNGAVVVACRIDARTWYLLRPRHRQLTTPDSDVKTPTNRDEALRVALRSYPDWVLADFELWLEIQEDATANLALSVEEASLLAGVAGDGVPDHTLPLFINGQAGSGKSTMLAFIFAALYKKKIREGLKGDPLYITYSPRLISRAKDATMRILRTGFYDPVSSGAISLDDSMLTWHQYLVSLLPESARERFQADKRVDFSAFRRFVERRNGPLGNYNGPPMNESIETLWFVIRSLIKGSESREDLDPEDYDQETSPRDRLVPPHVYKRIFDFYESHYRSRLSERGLWDDQDLVRAVLDAEQLLTGDKEVSALVIDEAQDFTRAELRLVTRTLVYSRYGPPSINPLKVPIVFAGDPLQTLSPTGFKWEKVRGGLYAELKNVVGDRANETTFKELRNNYRSTSPIVKLANSVQLWRRDMFGLGVVAQGAWNPSQGVEEPSRFLIEDHDLQSLATFLQETPIIVNCEDGDEVSFVIDDPILSQIFPEASEQNIPSFVFSSAAVKGLEFPKVVLYRFGETNAEIPWARSSSDELQLEAEYYFNKLYVGVTRATRNLYVLDSRVGVEKVWRHFNWLELRDVAARHPEFLEIPPGDGVIAGETGELGEGYALEGLEEENPEQNATNLMNFGIETRDPRHLRRAQNYFKRVANEQKSKSCEAFALIFEGHSREAARIFREIQMWSEAWEAAWSVSAWDELTELAATSNPSIPSIERRAAMFMSIRDREATDCLDLLEEIRGQALGGRFPRVTDGAWVNVVSAVTETLKLENLTDNRGLIAAECMERLAMAGFTNAADLAGDLFESAGDTVRALNMWERAGEQSRAKVATARALLDGLPKGLVHLREESLWAQILNQWTDNGRPINPEWIEHVVAAYRGSRQMEQGADVLSNAGAHLASLSLLWHAEPSEPQLMIHVAKLARSLGNEFDVGGIHELISEMRKSTEDNDLRRLRVRPVYVEAISTIVAAQFASGWDRMSAGPWIDGFKLLVDPSNGVASWPRTARTDAFLNYRLLLGAAFELAEDWVRAKNHYMDIIQTPAGKTELKLARERWLFSQWKYQLELSDRERRGYRRGVTSRSVSEERQKNQKRWQVSDEEFQRIKLREHPYLSTADEERVQVHSRGQVRLGGRSFEFVYKHGESPTVEVTIRDDDDVEICVVRLDEKKARFRQVWIESEDDRITISTPDWKGSMMVVELGEVNEFVFVDEAGRPQRYVVGLPEFSTSDRRWNAVTQEKAKPIKIFELAKELGVSVEVVKQVLPRVGIVGRRNGNDRLSPDQADRVRKVIGRQPVTD